MGLTILAHKKAKEHYSQNVPIFHGEWSLFTLIEKVAESIRGEFYGEAWKIIYDYLFDREQRMELLGKSEELIRQAEVRIKEYESNWRYAFISLAALHVYRNIKADQSKVEAYYGQLIEYLKSNNYFVKEKVLPIELGFAYGLWEIEEPLNLLRSVGNKATQIFKTYYYLAIKLTRKRRNDELDNIAEALLYDHLADVLFQVIAAACLAEKLSEEEYRKIFDKLQSELLDVREFSEIYLRRKGMYDDELELPGLFSYDSSQLYQFLIALRVLGLNDVVYTNRRLEKKINEFLEKSKSGEAYILSRVQFFLIILGFLILAGFIIYLIFIINPELAAIVTGVAGIVTGVAGILGIPELFRRIKHKSET